jgi:hypothetical protein
MLADLQRLYAEGNRPCASSCGQWTPVRQHDSFQFTGFNPVGCRVMNYKHE